MSLKDIECKCIDWIHLAQDKDTLQDLVNTIIKFRVP